MSTRRVRQVVAWVTTTIIATVSNGPENVAWACGTPVFPAPRTHLYASSKTLDEVPILRARMDSECVTLVWLGDVTSDAYHVLPADLPGFALAWERDDLHVFRGGACS
ncbi:hypothetical protein [Propioniciclava tarda]|uniref:Uncharacterized protein n=1 Tax=Propioniciclava tarda TaxID=433330 RepID=A0A4V2JT57_PROTD|nr:hypothetical protein [Propioniciclava tarda]TBT94951.1 hypothetical protein ET996_08030 [Propioniciclava tarda]SMO57867.1 hypothetical protein SAMN06266982_10762 [Propioniciclava tarda]